MPVNFIIPLGLMIEAVAYPSAEKSPTSQLIGYCEPTPIPLSVSYAE